MKNQKKNKISDPNNYACVIDSKLYIGNLKAALDEELLSSLGIKSIVSLLSDFGKLNFVTNKYTILKISTEDTMASTLTEWAEKSSQFIEENLKNNKPVLVHCFQGISRSCSCILYYLMTREKMKLKDAFFLLRQKRKIVCPMLGFFENLTELDKKLFGVNSFTVEEYSLFVLGENFPSVDKNVIKDTYLKFKTLYTEGEKKNEYIIEKNDKKIEPIGYYTMDDLILNMGKDNFVERQGCSIHHPFD